VATLYTQVASNRAKTAIYLAVYMALVIAIGYVFSAYYGSPAILLIAGIISVVQGWVSYYHADTIALASAQAVPLDPNQAPEVYKILENLSITAGIQMPRLYYMYDSGINAFATGRDAKHAAICVTRGALERLNENELTGVLAHELSHIGDEDIRLSSMVMVMAGLIALISDIFLRSLWFGGDRRRDSRDGDGGQILMLIAIALAVLAPIAATLIQLAISRKREFMADANGVLLTRYPEGLISALRKIENDDHPVEDANRGTAHMYFTNPLKAQWLASLFDTHPPIEERIKALQKGSGL
jgi:heat shock protein HtpX